MKNFLTLLKISLVVFCLFLNVWNARAEEGNKRIAVLPFENLTGDANLNMLSQGVAVMVISKLGGVPGIVPIERIEIKKILEEQSFQAAGYVDPKVAVNVGKLLGAATVVVGEFQKMGDQLAITARFVEVETGEITGTADVTGSYSSEIFSLENNIAFKLLKTLGTDVEKEPELKKQIETAAPTTNLSAFEWCSKGDNAYDLSLYDKAIDYYTKAIELDGKYAEAYFDRGSAYFEKELFDEAIEDFAKTIELNQKRADTYLAYIGRGIAYLLKQLYDEAIEDFTQVIKLYPKDEDVYMAYAARGYAYFGKIEAGVSKGELGKDEIVEYATKIIEDITQAIKLNPKHADGGADFSSEIKGLTYANVYFARGMAYYLKQSWDDALEDFTKIIELDPQNADAYYYRGLAYNAKSIKDKVPLKDKIIKDLRKAAELGNNDAKEALKNAGVDY